MELIRRMFGSRSLDAVLRRARTKLATGDFDQAHRVVAEGYAAYPGAEPLRDLELSIRRAQARAGIRSLRDRVVRDEEPRAYEELISLYLELGMTAEARKEATAYATAHPDRDSPHLLLGEMALQSFIDDLQARDAHAAHMRLRRAASLNEQAIKPRLLLAELYYCVGADHALKVLGLEIEIFARDNAYLGPVLEQIAAVPRPDARLPLEGFFERVEAEGALLREPRALQVEQRRRGTSHIDKERARKTTGDMVERGDAAGLVLLNRNGAMLASANADGLVDVARVVARTISRYARDLDLGAFKRCTIQGDFGLVSVGELSGVIAGARWDRSAEPQRLWERVSVGLEGTLGGRNG